MAYSFQTFSAAQVLTAAQMNQVEVNVRDHVHGVAGVEDAGHSFTNPTIAGATISGTFAGAATFSGALTLSAAGTALAVTNNATVGGTLVVTGNTTLTGDLAVNGGDLTTTASTFNLVNATATTVNFAGAATTLKIGGAANGLIGIGGAADATIKVYLRGTITSDGSGSAAAGLYNGISVVGASGDTATLTGYYHAGTIATQAAAESIAVVSSVRLNEPVITNNLTGGGVITLATTLYIAGAPTEGSTNAALYVESGATYLQSVTIASGQTLTLTGATVAGAPTWSSTQSLNTSGTAATVTTAAQPSITSLGTLTILDVDNLRLNGNTLSATTGAVNITPVAGSAIVLDGTINVDAGVVTGATSITSTAFVGALTGNADTATLASTVTVADSTSATCSVALFESATGSLAAKTDAGLTYNASTGVLTATGFSGPLTGNVTGNCSGTAATVTGAAQAAITSLGTLTSLTVSGTTTPQALLDISGASAGQIKFPATQNASADANTLDDYEEGTWTPSVGGTATYTAQTGTYTKKGREVTASLLLGIDAIGTGSQTTISGLPFTAGAANYVGSVYFTGLSANVITVVGVVSTNTIILFSLTVAGPSMSSANVLTNGSVVRVTVTYFV